MSAAPELAWLLPAYAFEHVADVVAALRAQTIADRVELVLVLPHDAPDPRPRCEGVGTVTVVGVADPGVVSVARAAGIRAARSPVVMFGETHAFPEPDCAEALVAAHREDWVTVGPAILNANPESALSRAAFLTDYGPWAGAQARGPRAELPNHNVAHKRAALLAYGDRLEARLADDTGLSRDLAARGGRQLLEPAARVRHLNISLPRDWAVERFVVGRHFAELRRRGWPRSRRVAYALGSPLIPFVRLPRILPLAAPSGTRRPLLPALTAGLAISAFGEAAGYLGGTGEVMRQRWRIELLKHTLQRPGEARP